MCKKTVKSNGEKRHPLVETRLSNFLSFQMFLSQAQTTPLGFINDLDFGSLQIILRNVILKGQNGNIKRTGFNRKKKKNAFCDLYQASSQSYKFASVVIFLKPSHSMNLNYSNIYINYTGKYCQDREHESPVFPVEERKPMVFSNIQLQSLLLIFHLPEAKPSAGL